ncbi:MAG: hypothetical protein ACTHQQ_19115 [Solirubrobacteraceae bacterium]
MVELTRTKVAAILVVVFLAAISTAGVLSHTRTPVTGHVATALPSTPALAQPGPATFEHESND